MKIEVSLSSGLSIKTAYQNLNRVVDAVANVFNGSVDLATSKNVVNLDNPIVSRKVALTFLKAAVKPFSFVAADKSSIAKKTFAVTFNLGSIEFSLEGALDTNDNVEPNSLSLIL